MESQDVDDFYYDAFISYRHRQLDQAWALWLHRQLEGFRTPRRLVRDQKVRAKLKRVFRDEAELSAAPDLPTKIREALQESRYLIIICSNSTPESPWVDAEVQYFIELGRQDRILTFLIDGEPSTSFPVAVRGLHAQQQHSQKSLSVRDGAAEPFAADVRSHLGMNRKRIALLRLLAPLLGVRYDDLYQRDRKRRRNFFAAIGLSAILLLFVLGWIAVDRIRLNEQLKIETNQVATTTQSLREEEAKRKQALDEQTWLTYAGEMERLPGEWSTNHVANIGVILASQKEQPEFAAVGGIEWYYWRRKLDKMRPFATLGAGQAGLPKFALAIGPNSRYVAVSNQRKAGVWELETGKELWRRTIADGPLPAAQSHSFRWENSVAFSPDGRLIAATNQHGPSHNKEGNLRVWEVETGKEVFVRRKEPNIGGLAVAFSPDSGHVVVDGFPWKGWDISRKSVVSPPGHFHFEPSRSPMDPPPHLFFQQIGGKSYLVTDAWRKWSWPAGEMDYFGIGERPPGRDGEMVYAGLGMDPLSLSVGLRDQSGLSVRGTTLRDSSSKRELLSSGLYCVDAEKGSVVAGCADSTVRLWYVADLQAPAFDSRDFFGAYGELSAVAISDKRIVCLNIRGDLFQWHADRPDTPEAIAVYPHPTRNFGSWKHRQYDLSWNAEESVYSIRSVDKGTVISKFDANSYGDVRGNRQGTILAYRSMASTGSPGKVKSRAANKAAEEIKLIEVATGRTIASFSDANPHFVGEGFNEEGNLFVYRTSNTNEVKVVEAASGKEVATIAAPAGSDVGCVSRTGKLIAIRHNKVVDIIDVNSKELIAKFDSPEYLCGFDESERYLMKRYIPDEVYDGTSVMIFEIASGSSRRFKLLDANVETFAISPDKRRLFVGRQNFLDVYSYSSGGLLCSIPCAGTPILTDIEKTHLSLIEMCK